MKILDLENEETKTSINKEEKKKELLLYISYQPYLPSRKSILEIDMVFYIYQIKI